MLHGLMNSARNARSHLEEFIVQKEFYLRTVLLW